MIDHNEGEVWKPIPRSGFSVSNMGRIRQDVSTEKHPTGKIVTPYIRNGKLVVSMRAVSATPVPVARLVWMEFVDFIGYQKPIYHVDGDFRNCKLTNLSSRPPRRIRKSKSKDTTTEPPSEKC